MKNGHGELLYETKLGRAIVANSLDLMPTLAAESVNLIMTSPAFRAGIQETPAKRRQPGYRHRRRLDPGKTDALAVPL